MLLGRHSHAALVAEVVVDVLLWLLLLLLDPAAIRVGEVLLLLRVDLVIEHGGRCVRGVIGLRESGEGTIGKEWSGVM